MSFKVYLRKAQTKNKRMTVPHGKACVDPYTQATVFMMDHTITSGTETPTD